MVNGLQAKQQEMMETYKKGLASGMTPKEAAKEAQARTGLSVKTGAPIRSKAPKEGRLFTRPANDVARLGSFGMFNGSD